MKYPSLLIAGTTVVGMFLPNWLAMFSAGNVRIPLGQAIATGVAFGMITAAFVL